MEDAWDEDFNEASIHPDELWRIRQEQEQIRRAAQRAARGYFEIPEIPSDQLVEGFPFYRGNNPDTAGWTANRLIWMCHDCGCFGYKYSVRETFKCYHYRCRSRNVTVMRAGEMSQLMQEARVAGRGIGVHMQDVFNQRRARLQAARRAHV